MTETQVKNMIELTPMTYEQFEIDMVNYLVMLKKRGCGFQLPQCGSCGEEISSGENITARIVFTPVDDAYPQKLSFVCSNCLPDVSGISGEPGRVVTERYLSAIDPEAEVLGVDISTEPDTHH